MKALLIAAAACAALSTAPAMAATTHYRPAERVQIIPLTPNEAMGDLGDPSYAASETGWAQTEVTQDPALLSALQAQGISPDRVLDVGMYGGGKVDIYVSG